MSGCSRNGPPVPARHADCCRTVVVSPRPAGPTPVPARSYRLAHAGLPVLALARAGSCRCVHTAAASNATMASSMASSRLVDIPCARDSAGYASPLGLFWATTPTAVPLHQLMLLVMIFGAVGAALLLLLALIDCCCCCRRIVCGRCRCRCIGWSCTVSAVGVAVVTSDVASILHLLA